MISDEVEERMQTTNFMRDTIRGVRLRVLGEEMAKDARTRIQYAAKYASSANYWKNAIGMNEGLVRLKVLDRKNGSRNNCWLSEIPSEMITTGKPTKASSRLSHNVTMQCTTNRRFTKP